MRTNRNKDFDNSPSSLRNAKSELNRIALTKDLEAINDKIYKGNKFIVADVNDPYFQKEEYEVRYELRKLYKNKCAYCERITYNPDIEHYRPKKAVSAPLSNNHGYYWLCYEWSNLIPSCRDCNSMNGKQNKFPILANKRITKPPFNQSDGSLDFEKCKATNEYLTNEKPALLHPEVDIPENYLVIKCNGQIEGADGLNGRGWHTIKICDLNRGNLRMSRKKIIDGIIKQIHTIFKDYRDGALNVDYLPRKIKSEFDEINRQSAVTEEYSFVSFYIVSNFIDFVNNCLSLLSEVEKVFLIDQYKKYIHS